MSRFLSYLTPRKRFVCAMLPVIAAVCALLYLLGFPVSEERKFQRFTEEVFCAELGGSTLNLHYTVANPERYGLSDLPVTLGSAGLSSRKLACAACENYLSALKQFDYTKLSESQQLTYSIFRKQLETELSASSLLLYDEPLSPTLGIQAQLPVLFAEYTFRTKKDVEDYLTLLTQVPDYFQSLLSFERDKANAGLFMSDPNAREVILQCQEFIQNPEDNYLNGIFNEKIDAVSNLTADEKIAYKQRSQAALSGYVIPAYKSLITGIQALLGSGKNEQGLYYLPQGVSYYEYLVRSLVGDDRPITEIEEAVKQQMVADFTAVREILKSGTQTPTGSAVQSGNTRQTALITQSNRDAQSFTDSDPVGMLQDLRMKITQDFPLPPGVSCEVKYVHRSLQNYLSPAFYLTPAIDNYMQNVIYINPSGNYRGLELYTTLAHEGYPGHLYQSVCFQAQSPDLLHCLLDAGGYVEGWATYVEMYAFSLWNQDARQTVLSQKNRSFTLGLASLLDIGIHYHGYSKQDVSSFLEKLGFNAKTADSLYRSILQSPANYLQYYVGYLNFQSLRDDAKKQLGERFSLKEFHRAVLETGPAPFSVLRNAVFRKLMISEAH